VPSWSLISLSIGIVSQSIAGIESVMIGAEDDINSACSNFTKTFLNITKTCIPTREVTIRSDDKVWFDSDLRRESFGCFRFPPEKYLP
jgi:hypothetical protein